MMSIIQILGVLLSRIVLVAESESGLLEIIIHSS